MSDHVPARLFLITPKLHEAADFAPLLEAALDAGDVACVLIRAAAPDEGSLKALIKALAPLVQARGAACLVEDNARVAPRAGADGVHVTGFGPAFLEAVAASHPDRIAGIGAIEGRDAAMEAGEAGADYLMFGGPGQRETFEEVLERVEWWANIFNVPCVGYARDPADAGALAKAGAEFIALCDGVWEAPHVIANTIAAVQRAIAPLPEATR